MCSSKATRSRTTTPSGSGPTGEAGGTKFLDTIGLVVRNNHVHHNDGSGLWTDIDNIDTVIEHNTVTDNGRSGIHHEISYAAVIRYNTVERNGFAKPTWFWGAGILVDISRDVEVYGNLVRDNANGITAVHQSRPTPLGAYGERRLENLHVHDNVIDVSGGGVTGVGDDTSAPDSWTVRNNRFEANVYALADDADGEQFGWAGEFIDWSAWLDTGQRAGEHARGLSGPGRRLGSRLERCRVRGEERRYRVLPCELFPQSPGRIRGHSCARRRVVEDVGDRCREGADVVRLGETPGVQRGAPRLGEIECDNGQSEVHVLDHLVHGGLVGPVVLGHGIDAEIDRRQDPAKILVRDGAREGHPITHALALRQLPDIVPSRPSPDDDAVNVVAPAIAQRLHGMHEQIDAILI